jgi:3-hydroxybutyryl-CoA dehydrogenase
MNARSYNSASVDLGSIVVVGGGTMGRGIAALCALSGCSTRIYEADESARRSVRSEIESSWRRGVEKGKLAPDAAAQAVQRLEVIDHLEFPDDCGFVLEAVPEQLELKQRLFAEIDRGAPAGAILASNTSSLSIAAIARSTGRPDRVIGIHFFNPVAVMPLVEIVRGPETSSETESRATALVAALGKQAVRVRDSPGFATSRLGLALGLEAMRMVEEGVASAADIDRAMELGYGHRMGPLKTSDLVGLDVRLAIAETLARELDPVRFRPPERLKRMVAAGRTGKKSGRGFYRWEGETAIAAAEETAEEKT